jgi:hypothetical protein
MVAGDLRDQRVVGIQTDSVRLFNLLTCINIPGSQHTGYISFCKSYLVHDGQIPASSMKVDAVPLRQHIEVVCRI